MRARGSRGFADDRGDDRAAWAGHTTGQWAGDPRLGLGFRAGPGSAPATRLSLVVGTYQRCVPSVNEPPVRRCVGDDALAPTVA
jgi:hypothetical protein